MNRQAWAVAGLALAGCIVLPVLFQSLAYQLTIIVALGLAALAVSLLLRAGLISFGHALFYAAGGYAAAYVAPMVGGEMLLCMLAALACSAVLSALIALFIVRYRGIFFAMLNLALSMVGYTLLLKLYHLTGGSDGLVVNGDRFVGWTLGAAAQSEVLYYLALASAVLAGLGVYAYLRAPMGWALSAVQDCEIRVEYLGVSARRVLFVAYVMSGALAGLGGGFTALAVGHIAPDSAYWTMSAGFLVMAVLGGSGSIAGAFVGAGLYELLSVFAAQYLSSTWEILLGVIIFVIIRFAPNGLWGLFDRLRPASAAEQGGTRE